MIHIDIQPSENTIGKITFENEAIVFDYLKYDSWLKRNPEVRILEFKSCNLELSVVMQLVNANPQIHTLSIDRNNYSHTHSAITNESIKTLKLEANNHNSSLLPFLGCFTKLRSLETYALENYSDLEISTIKNVLENLNELKLAGPNYYPNYFYPILPFLSLKNLKSLTVPLLIERKDTPKFISFIGASKLQFLNLENHSFTDSKVIALMESAGKNKNLYYINLGGENNALKEQDTKIAILDQLKSMPHLIEFFLDFGYDKLRNNNFSAASQSKATELIEANKKRVGIAVIKSKFDKDPSSCDGNEEYYIRHYKYSLLSKIDSKDLFAYASYKEQIDRITTKALVPLFHKDSEFSKLPLEIKVMIWDYVFTPTPAVAAPVSSANNVVQRN